MREALATFAEKGELTMTPVIETAPILRKAQLVGLLERMCQAIELTDTQYEDAKSRYEAAGQWLAAGDDPALKALIIYAQGSACLGTTVKPLPQAEHDVDLVSYTSAFSWTRPPSELKKLIGDRLRQNARYVTILEEKPRCWRLNYANEFHLDITPAIPDPQVVGGELVPEKYLPYWKRTNPRGYKNWFEARARLQPRVRFLEAEISKMRAQVEAFPEQTRFKGLLRRCVQICKRHRDIWFNTRESQFAPISIIVTTLAAKSYERVVANTYDTELDVLLDVVRLMPMFIETDSVEGKQRYFVWNETTRGENFAEKWNKDPRLAQAFYAWQHAAMEDLATLESLDGLDVVKRGFEKSFGAAGASAVRDFMKVVTDARERGSLAVTPTAGIITGAGINSVPMRRNTFFGS